MSGVLYSALTIGLSIVIIGAIIAILPTAPLPIGVANAITSVFQFIKAWSFLIDYNDLIIVMKLYIGTELILWTLRGLFWLYKRVYKTGSN